MTNRYQVPSFDDARAMLPPVARAAIAAALGKPYPAPAAVPDLLEPGASFVTLRQGGELRGCIGTIDACRPLIEDVRFNAVASALRDPRFPPVTAAEFFEVQIEVSVLSRPEPMRFIDEADLLAQLRPEVDGIVLQHGEFRATFLPQVWDVLPEPENFLAQLKRKAGLGATFWARDIRIYRYTVSHWSED